MVVIGKRERERMAAVIAGLSSSSSGKRNDLSCGESNIMSHHHRLLRNRSVVVAVSARKPLSSCTNAADEPRSVPLSVDPDHVDALLLLQKSMLEKQLSLCGHVTSSGLSARQRRMSGRRRPSLSPDVACLEEGGEELLSHAQVVRLCNKMKVGLCLEDHKSKLRERLGCEPSQQQLAASLRITRAEVESAILQSCLARQKLAMSNLRLVRSVAQKYDNMGAEMADLVQGGLAGLLRGIEKYDSSKGFRISTYVYWWIRQGVSKALVESSRTLRLPTHLHERLSSIRNAKLRLEEKGITPSVDRIAECLKMSTQKVRNATEAVNKVFSLDREAFPSLNGLPGETHHSYVADNSPDNIPWNGLHDWALKDEVNKLINTTLGERERDIIRLYYGLDLECLTWEDISKRMGLSRERVRQVGLVAMEKLKHAARRQHLDAMLLKQ